MQDPRIRVEFIYKNHKGETELRHVICNKLEWIEKSGFDYQPGWFLSGWDTDRDSPDNYRSFALTHIVLVQGTPLIQFPHMERE